MNRTRRWRTAATVAVATIGAAALTGLAAAHAPGSDEGVTVSETPPDDDSLVEQNLGGPQRDPQSAQLSAAEEYLKPRSGPLSNVTVDGKAVLKPADTSEDGQ